MYSLQSLAIVVSIVLFVGVFLFVTLRKSPRKYKAKGPYLLSMGETRFFNVLVQAISSTEYVCPKVRIADLVEVDLPKNDTEYWSNFNKISQKHVDFVIVNRLDFAPKLIVELDGGSHNNPDRLERDEFVDSVLKSAKIPIVHIAAQGNYSVDQLKNELKI